MHLQPRRCGPPSAAHTADRTVQPELERFLAKRTEATTVEIASSHVPMLSNPAGYSMPSVSPQAPCKKPERRAMGSGAEEVT